MMNKTALDKTEAQKNICYRMYHIYYIVEWFTLIDPCLLSKKCLQNIQPNYYYLIFYFIVCIIRCCFYLIIFISVEKLCLLKFYLSIINVLISLESIFRIIVNEIHSIYLTLQNNRNIYFLCK